MRTEICYKECILKCVCFSLTTNYLLRLSIAPLRRPSLIPGCNFCRICSINLRERMLRPADQSQSSALPVGNSGRAPLRQLESIFKFFHRIIVARLPARGSVFSGQLKRRNVSLSPSSSASR